MPVVELITVGGLLLAFVLVGMNGLFVAAGFASVRVRATRVTTLVDQPRKLTDIRFARTDKTEALQT